MHFNNLLVVPGFVEKGQLGGAINGLLDPFDTCTKNPAYLVFEEHDDMKEYLNDSITEVLYGGGILSYPWSHEFTKYFNFDYETNTVTPKDQNNLSIVSAAQQVRVINTPLKEVYKTYRDFALDYMRYQEVDGKFGYYKNPNGVYDWYQPGGRWPYPFLVDYENEDCAFYENKEGSNFVDQVDGRQYKFVFAARKKDIAWEAMRRYNFMNASITFQEYTKVYNDLMQGINTKQSYFIKDNVLYYYGSKVYAANMAFADFLTEYYPNVVHPSLYALQYYGIFINDPINGLCYKCKDNTEQFLDFMANYIASMNDSDWLITIDSHE